MVEALYEQYHGELVKWCAMMTGEKQSAEDLVQEAFVRALDNEELFAQIGMPQGRAWLYRTVKNLYVDRVRHARFETLAAELPEETCESEDYAAIEWKELLSSLDREERELFTMRYLGGYNASQLGRRFALPPGTVRAKLSRARRELKRTLEQGGWNDV